MTSIISNGGVIDKEIMHTEMMMKRKDSLGGEGAHLSPVAEGGGAPGGPRRPSSSLGGGPSGPLSRSILQQQQQERMAPTAAAAAAAASALKEFKEVDDVLFEWLQMLESYKGDVYDSLLQTLKYLQYEFFAGAAHAINGVLPKRMEFRPMVEMTPQQLQPQVDSREWRFIKCIYKESIQKTTLQNILAYNTIPCFISDGMGTPRVYTLYGLRGNGVRV